MGGLQKVVKFTDVECMHLAVGAEQVNLRTIAHKTNVRARLQARKITFRAEHPGDLEEALYLLDRLVQRAQRGKPTQPVVVAYMARRGKPNRQTINVEPLTEGQAEYLSTIQLNEIVFGLGPAGTGKTFLSVAEAVKALQRKQVRRLVLTRPAVEAGEKLGFLPGTASEKVYPYLQPLYDSLRKLVGKARIDAWTRSDQLEIAPLAYMRGRTLEDAFVLLDEAQNCTFPQLMMLLTRLGEGSRCVVNGDASQVDLGRRQSGLLDMVDTLKEIEGIGVYELSPVDVVRHPLVSAIIEAVEARQDRMRGRRYDEE